jgi:PAS domain S-box-containing protein
MEPDASRSTPLDGPEEQYRLLMECVTDSAIFFLDPEGRVAGWNAGAERVLGYAEDEVLGRPFALFFTPEDRERGEPERELRTAVATGRAGDDRWHLRKDGSRLWVSSITTALRDEGGRLRGFAKVTRDRSEYRQAAEALRMRERRFRALLENAWDGFSLLAPDATILETSPATLRLFGYTAEEFVGRNGFEFIHPEDLPKTQGLLAELLRQPGGRVTVHFRMRYKDGSWRWMEGAGTNLLADPDVQAIVVNYRDIGAQRAAEQALSQSETRFRRLAESNIIGVIIGDATGKLSYANDAYLEMLGYTREEFEAGKLRWRDATPPEHLPVVERAFAEARERGACTPYEKEYLRKDGSRVPVLLGFTVLGGLPPEYICFVLDLSEQKRVARQLQLLYEVATALALSGDPWAFIDDLYRKLAAQLGLEVYLNYLVEDDGRRLRLAHYGGLAEPIARKLAHLELGQAVSGQVAQERRPVAVADVQHSRDTRTGLIRSLGITAYACNPLVANGRLIGTLAFGTRTRPSFTPDELRLMHSVCDHIAVAIDRARLMVQLKQQAERLAETDRKKDEFLALLGHELRNPLAPVRNAVQLLKLREPAHPDQRWAVGVIDRQTQHLARLVNDLLDVSRILTGKVRLERRPVDAAAVVAHAVEISRPLVEARRHHLTVVVPEAPRVHGDLTRLAQALSNLIVNAAKYTPDGGDIRVSVRREEDTVVFRVRDNGAGIPAEVLPTVFELFAQASHTLDRAQGGLGIGLTLVRSIVERHGGTVAAFSEGPGRGSEFIIRLPALTGTPDGPPEAPGRDPASAACRRVLVVDDNRDAAESAAVLARLWGHDVRVAYDGPGALELAGGFQPEVVLLDIGLPGISGYDVARRLRRMPGLDDVLLVAVTGYGQDMDRQCSQEAGFDRHLVKPLEPADLQDLLAHGNSYRR